MNNMLKIKEITQKQVWESFLLGREEKTFLNSWNWGEFQKKMGNKIWRLGVYENESLLSVALVVRIKAKRGTFLFIPHAPVIQARGDPFSPNFGENGSPLKSPLKVLLKELKKIAKQENCSFIRIAPILERQGENIKIFKDLGFRDAPIHIHPELTWELDINPPENELLMNMRKTTRYLIRQAQKNKALEIIQSNKIEALEKFNQLYQETVGHHHFTPFSMNYLKNEFLSFAPDNQISIFFGKYKNEIISSAMIIFWQGIGFYHQGASSLKYPKIPVSYLLQWEAIKEAKKRGCKLYNFWGIAPVFAVVEKGNYKAQIINHLPAQILPKAKIVAGRQIPKHKAQIPNEKHPWAGLTLFKMGFGGYKKEYVKTQDLILSPKYWLNYIVEKIRKRKRGL